MKKMTLDKFIEQPSDDSSYDIDTLNVLMERHFFLQMMDIWGEADNVIRIYLNENNKEKIQKQLDNFHNVCNIIYLNNNIDDNVKWELKVAEWELFDFCLWDNFFQNDHITVMKWFDQWCYDINYSLLQQ